eukprot:3452020-Rhodomonas_salina.1
MEQSNGATRTHVPGQAPSVEAEEGQAAGEEHAVPPPGRLRKGDPGPAPGQEGQTRSAHTNDQGLPSNDRERVPSQHSGRQEHTLGCVL